MLTPKIIEAVEREVLLMLAAERDCYANWFSSHTLQSLPAKFLYGPGGGGYHAEAFGVMRAMVALGYCTFGAVNVPGHRTNAKWWFEQLENQAMVLERHAGGPKERYAAVSAADANAERGA